MHGKWFSSTYVRYIHLCMCVHTLTYMYVFLPYSLSPQHAHMIILLTIIDSSWCVWGYSLSFQFFYVFKRREWGGNPGRWGIFVVGYGKDSYFPPNIYFLLLPPSSSLVIELWIYSGRQDAFLPSFESERGYVIKF